MRSTTHFFIIVYYKNKGSLYCAFIDVKGWYYSLIKEQSKRLLIKFSENNVQAK